MAATELDEGAKTLAFLKSHRLPPTPQNYTLAYIALHDRGSPIGLAIKAITDEGYRIKQEEVDTIFERHGGWRSSACRIATMCRWPPSCATRRSRSAS